VGAYTSIDPASDSGCVTFAANTSADTAEYMVLPWSAGGAFASAPFRLQSAAPLASVAMSSAPGPTAAQSRRALPVAFDHFLRELGRTRRYPQVTGRSSPLAAAAPQPSAAAGPPTVGDQRTFKVCSTLSCTPTVNVGAVARAVGTHIAIYIDTLAPSPGLSASDLD